MDLGKRVQPRCGNTTGTVETEEFYGSDNLCAQQPGGKEEKHAGEHVDQDARERLI